jgi:uncharacterized protein (TIGR04255 family)
MGDEDKAAMEVPVHAYKRPPVIEALIDLQFDPPHSEKELKALRSKYGPFYDLIDTQEFEVAIEPNGGVTSKINKSGFKGTSSDGTDILVVQKAGLTTSRIPPYPAWDSVFSLARRNYDLHRAAVGHRAVTRIGIRYVNRIDVPDADMPADGARGLLNFLPSTPQSLEISPSTFSARVEFASKKTGFLIILQSSTLPPALINHTSYLLDIDVIKNADLPQKPEDIWNLIGSSRIEKNAIFESSITDALRKVFDK